MRVYSQNNRVTLTWSKSSMDVVAYYNISYRRTAGCNDAAPGSSIVTSAAVQVNELVVTHTVMNLEENIKYELIITAVNTEGNLSTTINATTSSAGKYCTFNK